MDLYKIKKRKLQNNIGNNLNKLNLKGYKERLFLFNQAKLKIENKSESDRYLLKYLKKKRIENGSSFCIGDQVMLCYLSKEKFNGFYGIVIGYIEETRRFCIKIENFEKSISVKSENIIHRFYGTEVSFPCCKSKHIQSLNAIFKNWRDVTLSQIKHWYSISSQEKPFEKHLRHHYKRDITMLDIKEWDDQSLLNFFNDFDLLFTCTRCVQFKVLTTWKMMKQTTKVWLEFSNLFFNETKKNLKELMFQYSICLKVFSQCFQMLVGRKRTFDMFQVEISKKINYSDAILPPFRCLSDKSIQTLEVCLKNYFKSPLQMIHINFKWKPRSKELGINTKIKKVNR